MGTYGRDVLEAFRGGEEAEENKFGVKSWFWCWALKKLKADVVFGRRRDTVERYDVGYTK